MWRSSDVQVRQSSAHISVYISYFFGPTGIEGVVAVLGVPPALITNNASLVLGLEPPARRQVSGASAAASSHRLFAEIRDSLHLIRPTSTVAAIGGSASMAGRSTASGPTAFKPHAVPARRHVPEAAVAAIEGELPVAMPQRYPSVGELVRPVAACV
jgi:hypothetical protein